MMQTGRSEDPDNPFARLRFERGFLIRDCDPRTSSGPAAICAASQRPDIWKHPTEMPLYAECRLYRKGASTYVPRGIAAQRQGENSSAQAPKRDSPPIDRAIMSNGALPET